MKNLFRWIFRANDVFQDLEMRGSLSMKQAVQQVVRLSQPPPADEGAHESTSNAERSEHVNGNDDNMTLQYLSASKKEKSNQQSFLRRKRRLANRCLATEDFDLQYYCKNFKTLQYLL